MALWLKPNGLIIGAVQGASLKEDGDVYLDDGITSWLLQRGVFESDDGGKTFRRATDAEFAAWQASLVELGSDSLSAYGQAISKVQN